MKYSTTNCTKKLHFNALLLYYVLPTGDKALPAKASFAGACASNPTSKSSLLLTLILFLPLAQASHACPPIHTENPKHSTAGRGTAGSLSYCFSFCPSRSHRPQEEIQVYSASASVPLVSTHAHSTLHTEIPKSSTARRSTSGILHLYSTSIASVLHK